LELRSRGVWTEEVPLVSSSNDGPPPVKRRRVQGHRPSGVEVDEVDLSTETEGEEDGMKSKHDPERHLRKQRQPSPSAISVASTTSADSVDQTDVIKVAKLEWLDRSLQAGELVPIDPFVVYQACKTENPTPAKAATTA